MEYYAWVLAKFVAGFVIIATHLYLSGRTQLSQMTAIDLIGNFILGGIIGGVIYSDTIPFKQYLLVLLIGVLLIYVLNTATKHIQLLRGFTIGSPIPIIKDGRFIIENLVNNKHKIDILRVASQLHAQGACSFQQVYYAQIEPGGELTVICDERDMPSVIVMYNSEPRLDQLTSIGHDPEWLEREINDLGLRAEDIFLAEFWRGELSVTVRDGRVMCNVPQPECAAAK
ncbi:hypothetical protein AQS70_08580 [Pseudomonas endophytica]|uniref:DUF421 domain-containing protein n=1 Tax=Pseudomonas endophytica TaxID=1563157 RepID=A0A0Q0YWU3_9PSED|nr:DUF421 domain-containing protein [Pseudomonas endophytica]KQB53923.1 hypothetical protein AQS70_08580 [Pseudomonas endophytica]